MTVTEANDASAVCAVRVAVTIIGDCSSATIGALNAIDTAENKRELLNFILFPRVRNAHPRVQYKNHRGKGSGV